MWSSYAHSCMQGLTHSGMPPPHTTAADFLAANQFSSPTDEENSGSGLTPLMFAAVSGCVEVVRELIERHANVNARVLIGDLMPDFGVEKRADALAMAAFSCPHKRVYEIISTLLEFGADPNSRMYGTGGTPLMAAVLGQSLEGVNALISCAGDRLDLELGLYMNNATALNLAGVISTYAIVEALILAGADRSHRYLLICVCVQSRLLLTKQCLARLALYPTQERSWGVSVNGHSIQPDFRSQLVRARLRFVTRRWQKKYGGQRRCCTSSRP